ncbi:MAG: hypothetical protein AAGA72_12695 [Pseudomonadota bacterium]
MEPKEGTLGNVLEAAWQFADDPAERQAYLDYLRSTGASEEYIEFVEGYWEARDDLKDTLGGIWDDFVDWVKDLFGKGDGRSG